MAEEVTLIDVLHELTVELRESRKVLIETARTLALASSCLTEIVSVLNETNASVGEVGDACNTLVGSITKSLELPKLTTEIANLTAAIKKVFEVQVVPKKSEAKK